MKKILSLIVVTATILVLSCGKEEKTPSAAVSVPEPQEVSQTSQESSPAPEAANPELSELAAKMNGAGFDVPINTLPSIDFELENLAGGKGKLSDYKGSVVFLNFWATWCGPCQSEMPAMENIYKELKDKGFVILAVDLAEEKDKVQNFVDEKGLTFPVLLDTTGEAGGIYDARSIPTTYIVDREGNILGRAIGVRPWEDEEYMSLFREILDM